MIHSVLRWQWWMETGTDQRSPRLQRKCRLDENGIDDEPAHTGLSLTLSVDDRDTVSSSRIRAVWRARHFKMGARKSLLAQRQWCSHLKESAIFYLTSEATDWLVYFWGFCTDTVYSVDKHRVKQQNTRFWDEAASLLKELAQTLHCCSGKHL